MHRFIFEKKGSLAIRFDLNPPSIQNIKTKIINSTDNKEIHFKLLSLPIYMVEQMKRITQNLSANF